MSRQQQSRYFACKISLSRYKPLWCCSSSSSGVSKIKAASAWQRSSGRNKIKPARRSSAYIYSALLISARFESGQRLPIKPEESDSFSRSLSFFQGIAWIIRERRCPHTGKKVAGLWTAAKGKHAPRVVYCRVRERESCARRKCIIAYSGTFLRVYIYRPLDNGAASTIFRHMYSIIHNFGGRPAQAAATALVPRGYTFSGCIWIFHAVIFCLRQMLAVYRCCIFCHILVLPIYFCTFL